MPICCDFSTPAVQNVRMGSTTNNQYAVSANIAPVQANINALSVSYNVFSLTRLLVIVLNRNTFERHSKWNM